MASTAPETDPDFEALLDHLKEQRGFDFTGYKRSSLQRRVTKRMEEVGIEGYGRYLDHLELHQDEFGALFNTILINVTSFFRDAEAFKYLEESVVPGLLERIPDGPVRVWSAGCASGEETYSLAMVFAEALGDEAYLERVKIYATDVDDDALETARAGSYPHRAVEGLSEERLARFFERSEQKVTFRKDLRRTIIFGRNDLVQDAPISRIDLLSCRNTLMYFTAETQARILARLSFALNARGVLFLGKSEMLITHAELFTPVDLKRRVFRKSSRPTFRDRLLTAVSADTRTPVGGVREAAFDATRTAELVVDLDGTVVTANARARALLGLAPGDLGRPLKDLEVSYRPVELRGPLERVLSTQQAETLRDIHHLNAAGEERVLSVTLTPLDDGGSFLGVGIAFEDVTEQHRVGEELTRSKRELETAYEELQSTFEELETTNEELQSTNEELETTNEELQSTNEELETMNEELQSTNEELETINEELRQRSVELDDVNGFMETILTSLNLAVAVLDNDQVVRVWNERATDMWGLRSDEVEGGRFFGLDIGLPIDGLRDAVRSVLSGGPSEEHVVEGTNRRGRAITCRVAVVPLGQDGSQAGSIVVMEQLEDGDPRSG